jgi:hypothetical protein
MTAVVCILRDRHVVIAYLAQDHVLPMRAGTKSVMSKERG